MSNFAKSLFNNLTYQQKKEKNVEQKGKMLTFKISIPHFFLNNEKKEKNIEQFDIFVFDIFLQKKRPSNKKFQRQSFFPVLVNYES